MSHRDDFVNVNLDITFPKTPCDILSVDVEDILGTHKTDVMGELHKDRINRNGLKLSEESQLDKNAFRGDMLQRIKEEIKQEQGCRIHGYLKVYRVPGNIHVASHPYRDLVASL